MIDRSVIGGCSVNEAAAVAASATLSVSRNAGSSARVGTTGRMRSPSHCTSSIAIERRKWPPFTASLVWYVIHQRPSCSTIDGCTVVADVPPRMIPWYVHGPDADGAVAYAMHAW